jgi:hypothetical protein
MLKWHTVVLQGGSTLIMSFVEMMKLSKITFFPRTNFCEGKHKIFWNIQECIYFRHKIFWINQNFNRQVLKLLLYYCNALGCLVRVFESNETISSMDLPWRGCHYKWLLTIVVPTLQRHPWITIYIHA